ncbi:Holliday junction resolvasome, helicase subunit [Pseudomonas sp. 8AS]|uniref:DUF2388 domain-containing protein n=1 Tax=Pseudomonas sp. 8AS TaxID=2653163 RepID=UPI0012F2ABBF|nr:DUF2388 domain-containing protein [Pseudomonas sp. 8AS]VXB26695.1 Holliday junction resolvasome, helicase subunit [Pseudomonas sp. 8AS]
MKFQRPLYLAVLGLCFSHMAMATSFVVTTDTTIESIGGTSDATSSSFKDDKIVLQARDDAASFVASQGEIRGALLENALRHVRLNYPTGTASDMQLAQAMLAR